MQLQSKSILAGILLAAGAVMSASATNIDTAIDKGVERAATAQQSQSKIDNMDDAIRNAEQEYRGIIKEVDGLNIYVQQLDKQLADQETELANVENSIHQVALIERQITPLMLKMIDGMARFVEADLPFQKDERLARVKSLQNMMGRSDVEVAEKYRQVMEAYQDEMGYGRTIKTYRATLKIENNEKEVDFLRVGRIALMYQSLDGENMGVWNNQSRAWTPLDVEYKSKLMMALRIAREQAAPDLIKVPLSAPVSYAVESK